MYKWITRRGIYIVAISAQAVSPTSKWPSKQLSAPHQPDIRMTSQQYVSATCLQGLKGKWSQCATPQCAMEPTFSGQANSTGGARYCSSCFRNVMRQWNNGIVCQCETCERGYNRPPGLVAPPGREAPPRLPAPHQPDISPPAPVPLTAHRVRSNRNKETAEQALADLILVMKSQVGKSSHI